MGPALADVVSLSPLLDPSPLEAVLWVLAVVFYGVGDYVTTVAAVSRPDAEERNPVVKRVFAAPLSPLLSFALLKAAAFGCFLAGYLFVGPSPVRPAIPGAVAVIGALVTLQNIRVLQR